MMPRLFQKYFFCVEVSKIPWLYFFLCFYVCGIVFARTRVSFFPLFLVAGVSFLFLTCHFPKKTKLLISVGSVLLFALGYSFTLAKSISGVTPPERLKISSGKVDIRGILFKFPERVRFGERLIIQTEEMRSEGRGTPVQVLVRVTCYNFLSGLQQGDSVQIENIRLKRPTNFNNPGGLNYRQYLLDRGIELTGSIRRESQITLLRRESSFSVGAFLYGLKTTMVRFIEENSGPEVGSFLKAASFGERGAVSPDMRDLFSKAGTSHILAVSGLHVGFVTFLFFAIFKKVFSFVFLRFHIRSFMLGHTGRYAAFLTIPFLSAYVLMVGNSPSSFRAAVMGVVFLLSIVIGKEREIYSVIALAAMVLLLEDPVRLFEIGFQLSFSAVFFIVYGYRRLFGSPLLNEENTKPSKEDTLRKFFLSGKKLFFISLIAGLATAPLTAHYFNIVSIISPISNCIVIPLLSVIVPFCLVISLLSLSWKMGAEFLLIVPVELSKVVLSVSEVFAKIPLAFVRVSTPDPLMVFIQLFFLGYGLTVFKMGKINKIQLGVFSSLVVCIVAFHLFFGTAEKKSLKVTYLDVGQGNSALIQTPQKINVLIDGGGAFGEFSLGRAVVAPFLWKKGITSLDYVIGTHQDKDHIGGLLFILKEFKVKEYIDNGRNKEELTTRILKVLREKKIHHRVVRKEESLVFPSGVHILFLKPEKVSTEKKSDNDSGLVIRTSYGKTSWLFNGDISSRVEEEVRNNQNISSTVMDAPHHGSRFSSSASYIEAVSPEFVVFSVGKRNQFGHPNTDVLKRYSESGAAIYRTDHHGAVRFESDGKTLSVHPTVTASTNEHGL